MTLQSMQIKRLDGIYYSLDYFSTQDSICTATVARVAHIAHMSSVLHGAMQHLCSTL